MYHNQPSRDANYHDKTTLITSYEQANSSSFLFIIERQKIFWKALIASSLTSNRLRWTFLVSLNALFKSKYGSRNLFTSNRKFKPSWIAFQAIPSSSHYYFRFILVYFLKASWEVQKVIPSSYSFERFEVKLYNSLFNRITFSSLH